jgi:hypothetical protein
MKYLFKNTGFARSILAQQNIDLVHEMVLSDRPGTIKMYVFIFM